MQGTHTISLGRKMWVTVIGKHGKRNGGSSRVNGGVGCGVIVVLGDKGIVVAELVGRLVGRCSLRKQEREGNRKEEERCGVGRCQL